MKELIRKFTFGYPKRMTKPVLWLFLESFSMSFPAIAVYFAINFIVLGFEKPAALDAKGLWIVAAALGGLAVLQLIISTGAFLGTYLPATVNCADDKISFIKKLRILPLGYFQKKESGELINTFTGDFLAMEQSMVGMFTGIFSVVFSCLFSSVIMFMFNPLMAVALYISVPVAALIIFLSMNLTARLAKRNLLAKDRAATYLNEYLMGMKTLKAYNQTGEGFVKLKEAYQHLMKVNIHAESTGGALLSLSNALVRLGLPLMCFAGAYSILGGRLSIVDYLGLIVIGTKIISPILTWVKYMVMLRTHYVSVSRIDEVMKQPPLEGSGNTDAARDICFSGVSFSYRDNKADKVLDQVSFTIPSNRLTAIVGPSGGGKSTILRLIARFWDTDSGKILCGGKPLSELDA